jgi:hypothetical protein
MKSDSVEGHQVGEVEVHLLLRKGADDGNLTAPVFIFGNGPDGARVDAVDLEVLSNTGCNILRIFDEGAAVTLTRSIDVVACAGDLGVIVDVAAADRQDLVEVLDPLFVLLKAGKKAVVSALPIGELALNLRHLVLITKVLAELHELALGLLEDAAHLGLNVLEVRDFTLTLFELCAIIV